MNVTQLLLEVRDMLDDIDDGQNAAKLRWQDDRLMRTANRMIRGIIRKQTEIDEGYHNCDLSLSADDAIQVHTDVFDYILPTWSMRVTGVRKGATSDGKRGAAISHADRRAEGRYGASYHLVANTTLRLRHGQALDLDVSVVKLPARLTRGTVAKASTAANELYLAQDGDGDFDHETEADSYRNAILELTGVDGAGHVISGSVARVTASAHRVVDGSNFYTKLTLDQDLNATPAVNDTYEFQTEVADEHVRLLVLLICRVCWESKGNNDELRAITTELNEEWTNFVQHIQPRQSQEPDFVQTNRKRVVSDGYDDAPALDIFY